MDTDQKFELVEHLLRQDRSVRRFDNSRNISRETLRRLVSLTRLCASGRNIQPLKYYLVDDAALCDAIFPHLAWAGYYKDWDGPMPSERPVAYIVQCLDTAISPNCLCDDGLHLQAISLGASALGIGGCIIKAFNAPKIAELLNTPDTIQLRYVYALGYPAEKTRITAIGADGDYKYYRDENDCQCVPKRSLEEILLN